MDDDILDRGLSRRDAIKVGLTSSLALAVAACGGSSTAASTVNTTPQLTQPSPALVKAAQAEGTLTMYSSAALQVSAALSGAFTGLYGIPVNSTRIVSSPLEVRFTAEAASGKPIADVIQNSDVSWINSVGIPKGWFDQPNPTEIPSLSLWTNASKYVISNTFYLSAISVQTIAYNTNLVKGKDVPTAWAALLDPKWKGAIDFTDPRSNTTLLAWVYLMQQTYGNAFVTKFGQQNLRYDAGGGSGPTLLAAGDVAFWITGSLTTLSPIIAAGAPIALASFNEPTIGSEQYTALVHNAPHPNAAKLFMNFALSMAGGTAMCKNVCGSVLHAPGSILLPTGYTSPQITQAVANQTSLLGLLGF